MIRSFCVLHMGSEHILKVSRGSHISTLLTHSFALALNCSLCWEYITEASGLVASCDNSHGREKRKQTTTTAPLSWDCSAAAEYFSIHPSPKYWSGKKWGRERATWTNFSGIHKTSTAYYVGIQPLFAGSILSPCRSRDGRFVLLRSHWGGKSALHREKGRFSGRRKSKTNRRHAISCMHNFLQN